MVQPVQQHSMYRFEVREHPEHPEHPKKFHIVIFAGNNEIVLSGQPQSNEDDCHQTVQNMTDSIFFMSGAPLYTEKSLKPAGWTEDRPLGGITK